MNKRLMNKIRRILILSTVFIPLLLKSQTNTALELTRMQFAAKQVISPSPEAAELGKYGNIPVSLFTGSPNVSIPMVELKGNVLSLPVSLSYNSSGFKPEDIAPWTGLGWALNAGGVITRSVLGDPDMDDNYFISPSPLNSVPTDEYDKQIYFLSIRNKQIETQPDIYYFNFMGLSGKFLVYPDGQVLSKEKSLLNIVRITGAASEKVFVIVDEQGIQYEFTELEKTTINPVDDLPNAPPMVVRNFVSAWYLSKVISPYGNEELNFEYYSPIISQTTISSSVSNNSITYTLQDTMTPNWFSQPPSNTTNTFHPPAVSIWKKFIKKVTLKKNNVVLGYIDFESDLNARQDLGDADFDGERLLKKIKLFSKKDSTSTIVKEFNLGYEYFGISQTETPVNYRRLKLKTVKEISSDTATVPSMPPYTFYYNGENNTMPERFTSGLDHWGYYNGQSNMNGVFPTLIPTVNVIATYLGGLRGLGANREPDAAYSTLTVLEKITYPTGGYTSFEYEGHNGTIWNNPPANLPVGGIRLKKMVDYSFTDKPAVVKLYEYKNEEGISSGSFTGMPYYYETSEFENLSQCFGLHLVKSYNVTISANSVFGLGSIQGSHIGYQRVTEYQTDLSTNQSLGKTIYTYEIRGFNEINDQVGNGDLKKLEVYNNGNKLQEEVTSTYTYEDFTPAITNRKLLSLPAQSSATKLYRNSSYEYLYHAMYGCYDPPAGYSAVLTVPTRYMATENYIQKQRKTLSQQTRKVFDNATGNYTVTTKTFTYGNPAHNYPTLIEEKDSKQEKFFTAIKYVADYTISCTPQTGSMASKISEMKSMNMMGIPVEKLQYRESAGGSNRRYITGQFTEYKVGLPEKIYFLQVRPMPTAVTTSELSCTGNTLQTIDANYRLAATTTYDTVMNLKEESKINDAVTTYFWGYGKKYPVAKVVGKTYTESLTSGINQSILDNPSSEIALRTELDKLRNLTGALVTTYTYKPMVGVTSETDARGKTIYYEYDVLNRLVNIKDNESNIVKNFKYNYGLGTAPTTSAQTLFYNTPDDSSFTKSGCTSGTYGDVIVYSVPYGKYVSSISQSDADSKALADIISNGQSYANSVGLCRYYSASKHVKKFKNDCTYEQGLGGFAWYDLPAGAYKSLVSQAHADSLANADVATLGQAYANANATCSCAAEGKRYINGVCETGTLYHASSVQMPNGQWQCAYYYVFSDAYTTGYYYYYSSEPCPIDP